VGYRGMYTVEIYVNDVLESVKKFKSEESEWGRQLDL